MIVLKAGFHNDISITITMFALRFTLMSRPVYTLV